MAVQRSTHVPNFSFTASSLNFAHCVRVRTVLVRGLGLSSHRTAFLLQISNTRRQNVGLRSLVMSMCSQISLSCQDSSHHKGVQQHRGYQKERQLLVQELRREEPYRIRAGFPVVAPCFLYKGSGTNSTLISRTIELLS